MADLSVKRALRDFEIVMLFRREREKGRKQEKEKEKRERKK